MTASPARLERFLAALVIVGLALRPQILLIGPIVGELRADLGMSNAVAGLLGTIRVLLTRARGPSDGPPSSMAHPLARQQVSRSATPGPDHHRQSVFFARAVGRGRCSTAVRYPALKKTGLRV